MDENRRKFMRRSFMNDLMMARSIARRFIEERGAYACSGRENVEQLVADRFRKAEQTLARMERDGGFESEQERREWVALCFGRQQEVDALLNETPRGEIEEASHQSQLRRFRGDPY